MNKPWLTKGLKNACKKKNTMYKEFLKQRTLYNEDRYKRYKNKLTKILRRSKKMYFDKLLKEHKNDIQGTWKILNNIIKGKQQSSKYPDCFVNNGSKITNKRDIKNGFNDLFC